MTDKRRFIEQLPYTLRTEDLKKFFSSTVDHVFQPGKAQPISGYIGRLPSYYDATRDFYIEEPTAARSLRQLEPAMVTKTDTAIASALFYDDLVDYLASQGANVNDRNRLFDSEYYSWSPPIDLGKLMSPQNYFWFGDNPIALPGLLLSAPICRYIGDATQSTYRLPPAVAGIPTADETVAAWVNGVQVNVLSRTANTLTLTSPPVNGAIIEIYRHGNLTKAITGKQSFDPTPFVWPSFYYTGNAATTTFVVPPIFTSDTGSNYVTVSGGVSVFVNNVELLTSDYSVVDDTVVLDSAPANNALIRVVRYRDTATDLSALVNGMRVVLSDARVRATGYELTDFETSFWDDVPNTSFMVDGVGQAIELVSHDSIKHPSPLYTVIDRRSRDKNPWSQSNMWVHRQAFEWAHVTFGDRAARRPIVEFQPNIELYNHGRIHKGYVDRVISGITAASEINGQPSGSIDDDNGDAIEVGQRILIRSSLIDGVALSQTVAMVGETIIGGNAVMALQAESGIVVGDSVTTGSDTYHKTNEGWVISQGITDKAAPLFALYDRDHNALDDDGFYPSNDFNGSKIFGFASRSIGTVDTLIGLALQYDSYGQIVFENHINTQAITYGDEQSYSAMKFYRVLGTTPAADLYETDWHPIDTPLTLTEEGIPQNLQANPDNEQISFISKNEWNEHFYAIVGNQIGFEGDAYGTNNWHSTPRDLAATGNIPLRILQHRAPMLKTMLLASNKTYDFPEAIRYVENEYARFRARFINSVMIAYRDGTITDGNSNSVIVNTVLKSLKINKTVDFPFALNRLGDPSGLETFFIPPSAAAIGITPARSPMQAVDTTFGSPVTILIGHDGSRMPIFGDTMTFVGDGSNTNFVMGAEPMGPITVTVGTTEVPAIVAGKVAIVSPAPASGVAVKIAVSDIRDRALLALEQAIYNTMPPLFRSENAGTGTYRGFELDTWTVGRFRSQDAYNYTREEIANIQAPMFLLWAQKQGVDYRANTLYDTTDPFSWNYSAVKDRYGDALPGNWRGIYRWYFDTDRPHLAPWEMLGFAQKPQWWDDAYGLPPFASNNTMWADLRDGRIRQGLRQGIDPRYVRPDLLTVLPVDNAGNLRDPIAAGIVPQQPSVSQAASNWVVGDHGPIEHLWRTSPSYPFSRALTAFLLKPTRFTETMWDPINMQTVNEQWLHLISGRRPRAAELFVHGERDTNGARRSLIGMQEWISERMISLGQEPASFGADLRSLGVQLGHKVAGFLKNDNLRVTADNFGLVPEEDTSILLYTSPSSRRDFYSGVILEWSGSGWRVFGYDAMKPSFDVIPNDTSGDRAIVSIAEVPELVILDWKPNIYYKTDVLVDYKGSIYQTKIAHTSTTVFEESFWDARPGLRRPDAARVVKYLRGTGEVSSVPYGTEFHTFQEVADFIFSYERYLLSRGWVFEEGDESGPYDWSRAIREFLEWASLQWESGNFIALSPGAVSLSYHVDHGMIYSLEQAFNGSYGVVDRSGLPIDRRDTFVSRLDGEVTIRAKNNDLYGVRLHVGEVEHALIFSNETIFGDIIYKPVYDLRQPRLRISGHRAPDWNGRFDAPGFIITDSGIVSNFESASEDIRTAFDIEGAGDKKLRDHARHLVGYESRGYLRDLLLSETQQFEFYQGMIQQKGTPGVFSKTLRSQFIEQDRNLRFLEEWAFKSSSFGGLDNVKRYAFELPQSSIERNPQLVKFTSTETPTTNDILFVSGNKMVSGNEDLPNLFATRPTYSRQMGDLPSAGYVRLDEVSYTTFDLNTLSSLYVLAASQIGHAFAHGDRIWVYDADGHDWDVLRATNLGAGSTENTIVRVEISTDASYSGARIVLAQDHGLTPADKGLLIVIDGETRTDADLAGVHRIFDVGSNWIELEMGANKAYRWVDQVGDDDTIELADDPENAPSVRALRSVRFANMTELTDATWFAPVMGELAYIDIDPTGSIDDPRWVVRQYATDWTNVYRVQPLKVDSHALVGSAIYDRVTQITRTRLLSEPLTLGRLVVIDPLAGLLPGEAERERRR